MKRSKSLIPASWSVYKNFNRIDMSSLVDSKPETESTSSSARTPAPKTPAFNEEQIQDAIISDVTTEFVETFLLQNAGDYCFTKTLRNQLFVSMHAEESMDGGSKMVHLQVRGFQGGYGIRGLLFVRAHSLSQLLQQLHQNEEILSGVLDKKIKFERLLTPSDLEIHNIHFEKKVDNVNVLERSVRTLKYTGKMKLSDGIVREALFEESMNVDGVFLEKFFEQLVAVANISSKNLPIRLPIAAFLRQPTMIYEKDNGGIPLNALLKHHGNLLDLTQRVKLCSSAVRIMSELHHCDVFHGAVLPNNFFASHTGEKDGIKEYELVFNGARGLLFAGKSDCSVQLWDYDTSAPEIAFTRKLSKESGVFNMGRLFEQILKPEIMKTYETGNQEPLVLREIRHLIGRATRANPSQRPTMNGVVMMIRETLKQLPPSCSTINFVHFDQFPAEMKN